MSIMPPKSKTKDKKDLTEKNEIETKNAKNKRKIGTTNTVDKTPAPKTQKKKASDEIKSFKSNGRKRKSETEEEEKDESALTRKKFKDDDDNAKGDNDDVSRRKSKGRNTKKLSLGSNKDLKTKNQLKDDDLEEAERVEHESEKSESEEDEKLVSTKNKMKGDDVKDDDPGARKKQSQSKKELKLEPKKGIKNKKKQHCKDNVECDESDDGKLQNQSKKKQKIKKKKLKDDVMEVDDSDSCKSKYWNKNTKKQKLAAQKNESDEAKDRMLETVVKTENDNEDSDYIKSSRRKSKGNNSGKSAIKTVKDVSIERKYSVEETENDLEDSDTDNSDFEEVEQNREDKILKGPVTVDIKTEEVENEVGVMSDSDSDFEEVTSQTSSSQKPRSKPKKMNQTSRSRKGKTRKKSEPKQSKEGTRCRKRQGNKSGSKETMKKVKKDLVVEMPSTCSLNGIDEDDVTAVLLRMEGASCSQPSTSEGQGCSLSQVKGSSLSDADSDEDASDDWEEVEDHKGSPLKSRIPKEPVEITLEAPDFLKKKRKKKKFDWLGYVQRTMRRFQKDVQINMHKVHLLCLLSHGFQQNRICNEDLLKAQAISVIPAKWTGLESNFSRENIRQLLKWFREEFTLQTKSQYFADSESKNGLVKLGHLESVISSRQIHDGKTLAIIFIVILRTLGLDVRLVMSFHPIGIKLTESKKYKVKQKKEGSEEEPNQEESPKSEKKIKRTKKSAKKVTTNKKKSVKSKEMNGSDNDTEESEDGKVGKNKTKTKHSQERERGKIDGKAKNKKKSRKGKQLLKKPKPQSDSDSENEEKPKRNLRIKEKKKMAGENKDGEVSESGFDEFEPSDSDTNSDSDFSDEVYKTKKRKGRQKSGEKQATVGKKKKNGVKKRKDVVKRDSTGESVEDAIALSSGSDFTEEETSFRSPLQEKLKRKNRKVLSSDSDNSDSSGVSGCDIWTEVFLPGEKKWVCVDCVHNIVGKPYEIESGITQPVHYVLAYTTDGSVSDVTARYASQWMSQTRKLRVDPEWWSETLVPYKSQLPEHGDQDEESIRDQLMKRPLPTSIGEFKNHPLYALPRHLLKFEAIYPETAIPFGYIRSEAIYARECVHTLHSRENWLKEGRAVRLGEEPYKMVKSRKRWKHPKPDPNVLDLELFGHWQTEKYIPPPAVDGKITRNEYGNIELFQPWMLPGGTVHLQGFPALNRVSKKLGLDCVPAMVGWDNHGGFSHPLIDGWVVCEEHKDILIAAWDEDQEIQKQREIEKREKRVLENWKLLTRSLLIRERLRKKFDLKDAEPEEELAVKGGEKAVDTDQAWPRNREAEKPKKRSKYEETM